MLSVLNSIVFTVLCFLGEMPSNMVSFSSQWYVYVHIHPLVMTRLCFGRYVLLAGY